MSKTQKITGLKGSAVPWHISSVLADYPCSLILCADEAEAERCEQDISFFAKDVKVLRFPAWDTLAFEMVSPAREITAQRNATLLKLQKSKEYCIVTSVAALLQKALHPNRLQAFVKTLYVDAEIERESLHKHLEHCGFKRVTLVEAVGDFAVRGGIVDFFPSDSDFPIRLDFFDTEIEAIKLFDPRTQRSIRSVDTSQ